MELYTPGPDGESHDLWNVPVNADDDGTDGRPRQVMV